MVFVVDLIESGQNGDKMSSLKCGLDSKIEFMFKLWFVSLAEGHFGSFWWKDWGNLERISSLEIHWEGKS